MEMLKRFVKDERGLEASEYALLLALICIFLVVAIGLLRDSIAAAFTATATTIDASVAGTN